MKRTIRSALLHISAMIALSACATTQNKGSQLIAAGTSSGDAFGYSFAISGNTALVSAFLEDTAIGEDAGAAYVFILREGKWQREARLTAPDGAAGDTFGSNVAIYGDTALVGVMRDSDAGAGSGSVHVLVRSSGQWTHQANRLRKRILWMGGHSGKYLAHKSGPQSWPTARSDPLKEPI